MKSLDVKPDSPKALFLVAAKTLKETLRDESATSQKIADAFATVLELLESIPVEKPVYAAAKAHLVLDWQAICHELLDGKTGMDVRRAAAWDIDQHSKTVIQSAWV